MRHSLRTDPLAMPIAPAVPCPPRALTAARKSALAADGASDEVPD
jgi:hypothetical protein